MGEGTQANTTIHPPEVTKLIYEFEGWSGDSIVTSFPCYIITEELARSLTQTRLSGYKLARCEVTKSETFNELYPNRTLPFFVWLKVVGESGIDDFGIGNDLRLVVSDVALSVLKEHSLHECEIEEIEIQ